MKKNLVIRDGFLNCLFYRQTWYGSRENKSIQSLIEPVQKRCGNKTLLVTVRCTILFTSETQIEVQITLLGCSSPVQYSPIKNMGGKSIIIYKTIRLATGWKQQQYCRNITGKVHWGHFKYNQNHKMMAGVFVWNEGEVMRCEIREDVSVTWMSSLTAILEIMAIRPCNSVKTKTLVDISVFLF